MKTYISKPFQAEQFTDQKHLPPGVTKGGTCKVYMQTQICWAAPPHYHTANRTIVEVPQGYWVLYAPDGTVAQAMPDTSFKRDFVPTEDAIRGPTMVEGPLVGAEPPMPDEVFERALKPPHIFQDEVQHVRKSRKPRPSAED